MVYRLARRRQHQCRSNFMGILKRRSSWRFPVMIVRGGVPFGTPPSGYAAEAVLTCAASFVAVRFMNSAAR